MESIKSNVLSLIQRSEYSELEEVTLYLSSLFFIFIVSNAEKDQQYVHKFQYKGNRRIPTRISQAALSVSYIPLFLFLLLSSLYRTLL
eukprot:m.23246 g.23246  ORF g.23246 m.23246 type:complete len:88 (+) comp8958_c0_seq1:342-605(+)